jgi:hypothetical protein
MQQQKNISNIKSAFIIILIIGIAGCATYYQKNEKIQKYITNGKFDKASQYLEEKSPDKKDKNKILYYLNKGYINFITNEYTNSNQYFHKADDLIEVQTKSMGKEALALLLNPSVRDYQPEDFEKVMLHYFTSMNYIQLNDYEDALVEARRVNIKLHELNDQYKDHKNKYQRDAFAHNLMGMLYEASGEYNNAFIAYRNAYEVYEEDYAKYFGIDAPRQLKIDMLNAAYKTGFYDEVDFYTKKFKMDFKPDKNNNPELIFFWLNGFGPVKSEWSIMFTKSAYDDGYVTFANEQYGLTYRYYVGDKSSDVRNGFKDLSFFRMAFPKYNERKPVFKSASISYANNKSAKLELAQDINKIAHKTLNDRMLREFANALLRVATKKALEKVVNSQNENAGTVVSIANAITEKADTRNWQTLPYAIHYTRIPLKEGQNTVYLNTKSNQESDQKHTFTINARKGGLYFEYFQNLETYPPDL